MDTKKKRKPVHSGLGEAAFFTTEQKFVRDRHDDLVAHWENKFIVVHGKDMIGPFDSDYEAYTAALGQFGNVPFLIYHVAREDRVEYFPALEVGLIRAAS